MHQLNEEIRDSEVRLIGSTGEQLGIMSAAQAQHIADEQGLDLVKISPQATPPVCKLMDYGKYRFEQSKREKEARKNQHVVEIKEGSRKSPKFEAIAAAIAHRNPPSWLELDKENLVGRVAALPKREDVDLPINEQLIVELYSR